MCRSICIFIFFMSSLAGELYAQAPKWFSAELKNCDAGDFGACYTIGVTYASGDGVERDYKKAKQFFEEACRGGEQAGCADIAYMHLHGYGGLPENAEKAAKLFRISCEKGSKGCHELGELHLSGIGVKKNIKMGIQLMDKGCQGGEAEGCKRLYQIYDNGKIVQRDYDKSWEYYAAACLHGVGKICYEIAEILRIRKSYDDAFTFNQLACEHGTPIGCWTAGRLYEEHFVKNENYDEVVRLYRKGCAAKNALSCNALGVLHHRGSGVQKSARLSVQLYEQACELKSDVACRNVSKRYEEARGVKLDSKKAFIFAKKACELGDIPTGCNLLAEHYSVGFGTKKNEKKAIELHVKNCEIDGEYCNTLGILYENKKAYKKARKYFRLGCEKKYSYACNKLAHLYNEGIGSARNVDLAERFFKEACELENDDACRNLANLYWFEKGPKKNYQLAVVYLKKACDAKLFGACTTLGFAYERGLGVGKDSSKAIALYSKACTGGNSYGCKNLGYSYEKGIGLKKNRVEALSYYRKSCKLHNALGCENAGILLEHENKFEEAGQFYLKACESKVATSCSYLGDFYYLKKLEKGSKQDFKMAFNFATKACGLSRSQCTNLAKYHYKGIGTPKNHNKAFTLYAKSCEIQPDDCYQLGRLHHLSKRYNKAHQFYQIGCKKGESYSCRSLANLYDKGLGIERSFTSAVRYYKKSCNLKNTAACGNLGYLYRDAKEPHQNYQQAAVYFDAACDDGDANSCTSLGFAYEKGQGVVKNLRKANELYLKGCAGKNKNGCRNLAINYEYGHAVKKNKTTAFSFYQKACKFGNLESCQTVGKHLSKEKKYEDAAESFLLACEGGRPKACSSLANLHYTGLIPHKKKAIKYYGKACEGKDTGSCGILAIFLELGYLGADEIKNAIKYHRAACEQNSFPHCGAFGRLLLRDFRKENQQLALKLLKKGCDKKNQYSCVQLGILYEKIGGKKYKEKAIQLFSDACSQKKICIELAARLKTGNGISKDIKKAETLFEKSIARNRKICSKRFSRACLGLGRMYRIFGKPEKAKEAYEKACKSGTLLACQEMTEK